MASLFFSAGHGTAEAAQSWSPWQLRAAAFSECLVEVNAKLSEWWGGNYGARESYRDTHESSGLLCHTSLRQSGPYVCSTETSLVSPQLFPHLKLWSITLCPLASDYVHKVALGNYPLPTKELGYTFGLVWWDVIGCTNSHWGIDFGASVTEVLTDNGKPGLIIRFSLYSKIQLLHLKEFLYSQENSKVMAQQLWVISIQIVSN